ncbi:MAG TPA: segregation/condensation protein A [Thermoanaerobaculia bacterium]|jgi:segregation and condensation protein A|nr:segregation/condensation protein A [Thermoanaerobaculia bacterium]
MSDETDQPDLPEEISAESEAPASEPAKPRRRRKGRAAAEESAEAAAEESAAALLPEAWQVHLPIFDGPLDLLLHLIKLNRVEITDIPVATICDQFHAYMQLMEELNLDVAGEYIYEAAVLIHIKSKMLLPRTPRAEGEPEEDPRQELVDRLLEYRRLKEIAQSFAEVDRTRMGIWTRRPQPLPTLPEEEDATIDLGEVSLFDLLGALKTALVRYDREHPPPLQLSLEEFSVRGQFDRLMSILDAGHPYDLIADLRERTCRAEAIATFLAVLELARLNLVRVHQTESGDVLLYRTTRELGDLDREAIGS